MSDKPRVIIEHRAADPIATRARKALQSERNQENWLIWVKLVNGGIIECTSYGMAVNVRQSLYGTRKLSRQIEGATPFDHLTIRLNYNESTLTVEAKGTGIISITPNGGTPTYTEDHADTAFKDRAYVIPTPPDTDPNYSEHATTTYTYPPATYEGDGRPPIDLDEIFPTDPAPPKTTE